MAKPRDYYFRYNHFLKLNLDRIESFAVIKRWLNGKKMIIDVGCGVGHLTTFWKAIGIDYDKEALENAKKNFPNTKFIQSDVSRKIPFADQSVDAIVCYNVLEHMTDRAREGFFEEARRVLKKEGIIIAAYIDEDFWFNRLLALIFPNYGLNDPTHLVSWKLADFKEEIGRHFKIISTKMVSPYGKLIFMTRFLKGEMVILAKKK